MCDISLRDCQQYGYDEMEVCPIGIVKMFCGTGKTRLFTKFIIDKKQNFSIIVFPRIILMNQYHRDYITHKDWKKHWKPFHYIGICSDTEVADGSKLFTTSKDTVKEFIETHKNTPKVITVTYHSLGTLVDVLKETKCSPDVVICDEAHHVTTDLNQELLFTPPMSYASMRFLFTATPTSIMLNNPTVYGSVIYNYSHRDAVNDGICNDFVISIMMSAEEVKETHIYNAITRASVDTKNGRALVYHTYAEADAKLQRTSVKQFKGQQSLLIECAEKLKEEKGEIGYTNFVCQAVTASTKDKNKILKQFEEASSNTLFVLHNCSVIAEGVDTKSANMCVFADPKQSFVSILQNIGRITRIGEGETHSGCVLIPCFVDKKKYESANGDKDKVDEILREDLQETGNFSGILNVLAALRQDDPDLFAICLQYPKSYAPREITHEFFRKGWEIQKEADSIGELFDKPEDIDTATLAEEIEKHIIVHTLNMETPIEHYNENQEEVVVVFYNDEEEKAYIMVKKVKTAKEVGAPVRTFKLNINQNNDARVLWDIIGSIEGKITTAFIDCNVISGEDKAIAKANECVEWSKANNNKKPVACCGTKTKMVKATDAEKIQHKWAQYISDLKKSKKGGRGVHYESVEEILITHFGEDILNVLDLEDIAIAKANECIAWSKANNNKKPAANCYTKKQMEKATEAQKIEYKWVQYIHNLKSSKKGSRRRGGIHYESVEAILIAHFGKDVLNVLDLEDIAISKVNECVEWSKANDNKVPIYCCQTKEKREKSTEAEKIEHKWAGYIGNFRQSKKGNGRGVHYESVEKILISHFGKDILDVLDFEDKSITKANECVEWSKANNNKKPVVCCYTKEKREKATEAQKIEQKWAGYIGHLKRYKKGTGGGVHYESVEDILIAHFGKDILLSQDDKSETSSQKSTKERTRKPIKEPDDANEEKTHKMRELTQFEKYHQVFKRMKGENYTIRMAENPTEWYNYHNLAEKYDTKDTITPIDKITTSLQKVKKGRNAIDLGCGLNTLAPKNSHLKWTSVDVVAVDETVNVANLTNLPFEDETYHIAILCRSLWAIDREKVLTEAMRILVEGGQLIIVEAFRGWWNIENKENELITLIKSVGFDIIDESGTKPEETGDVFQYIVVRKPTENIKI